MSKYFISYPSSEAPNPFIRILNDELKVHGWIENKTENVWMNPLSVIGNRNKISLLYFHWPETFWRHKNKWIGYLKSLMFIFHVYIWKMAGYKIVFSAHNIIPHYGKLNFRHELLMRKFIVKNFHLVVGHSHNTYEELTVQIGVPKNYMLALHGLYENVQAPAERKTALTKLFVAYSTHEYKGVADFFLQILTFEKEELHGIQFIITGNIPDSLLENFTNKGFSYQHIKSTTASNFLSEEELECAILLSDIVVLPYKKITNSGFYFMALTMGKGVLASNVPFFLLHSDPKMILTYDVNDKHSLKVQLEKIQQGWYADITALITVRNQYSWKNSAKEIAAYFDKI